MSSPSINNQPTFKDSVNDLVHLKMRLPTPVNLVAQNQSLALSIKNDTQYSAHKSYIVAGVIFGAAAIPASIILFPASSAAILSAGVVAFIGYHICQTANLEGLVKDKGYTSSPNEGVINLILTAKINACTHMMKNKVAIIDDDIKLSIQSLKNYLIMTNKFKLTPTNDSTQLHGEAALFHAINEFTLQLLKSST